MEKLLSPQELSKITGFKISYIYHLTYLKRIPFLKFGCMVRFKPRDIEKWLADCEVNQTAPTSNSKLRRPRVKAIKASRGNTHVKRLAEKARQEILG